MKKANKKDERDIELITLIENQEEFISKLPWEEGEITPIHIAELAKKELKGKTTHKIGGGNSGCIKRLMTALEKEFSGRLFRIRLSGSDRFWSLTNPELLKKFKIQFEKIEETTIIVPREPEVVIPSTVHVETPIETSTSEHKEIEVKKKDKPVPAPEKEDMLKAYLLLELLMCGEPYPSSKIKEISQHMGWKIPIYGDVNQVLKYYELKNVVDTSGKRVIKLTPEIKREDEDIHLLISMLESEVSPIPEDITYFIEMGDIRKIEEKETIPSTTEEEEPSLELEEKMEEQKEEEKKKEVLDMDKSSQLNFLKKFLYDSGKYVVFQSELFQKIRLLHLNKITKPYEDFRDDPDVRIEPSRLNKDLGVREVRYVLTDSYCNRMKHDDTTEEEQTPQPEETVEVVIQEPDHHQPESKAETKTKSMMIELYSTKELSTGMKFSYSKQILLSIWKYGIQVETKEDALRLIKLYYSHLGEVEFEDGATILAALDNIVLS